MASLLGAGFGLLLLAAACAPAPQTSGPPNLGELKRELVTYKETGRYESALAAVVADARAYLDSRTATGGKLAIVLDIDETSLSNWEEIKINDFGFIPNGPCDLLLGPCGWDIWVEMALADPIRPTLALFEAAKSRGVAVFFVTGRKEIFRGATERNLAAAGYRNWAGLYMAPAAIAYPSAADFKAPVRRKLVEDGWAIIINMGDQPSDLAGGFAERTFLLPNPFYRIP